uniref:Protein kinase domain-containing protein n=1 Tax=Attheya septentrionalis TaxID=420275 RepID=A0A7S2XKI1_9STRA|mmetsp:Transcript_15779/g.28691  ORF Transcript_15779/g.28691 Transcript_15779/m.28691 type:complete len:582 (+) Transcript_15779:146-1891(+)
MAGRSSSLFQGNGGGSRKASKKSASDSPSASAANDQGKEQVNRRLRSVLSHPLALPLLHMLHGNNPGNLDYLSKESEFYKDDDDDDDGTESTSFDCIFENTFNDWLKVTKRDEPGLTKALAKAIEDKHEDMNFHSDIEVRMNHEDKIKPYGKIDILLTPEEKASETKSTPFAIIDVGRNDVDWWKKMDQSMKYLAKMGSDQTDNRLRFEEPLLLVVLTIEGGGGAPSDKELKVRLGVFFCSPKSTCKDDYRISLLWQSHTNNLTKASKDFGRLLRATSDFSRWRVDGQVNVRWEYLGPNCCKVEFDQDGQQKSKVLRSYDTRFRSTQRRSEIYEHSSEYEKLSIVPTLSDQELEGADHNSWLWPPRGGLLVIAAPYREGRHFAKTPAAFIPIINELEKLHNEGFVHGDIRGFNTVFTDEGNHGWLIDFDFGGKVNKAGPVYPDGYKRHLGDGKRIGKEENRIEKWHDFYALGNLFFSSHEFVEGDGKSQWFRRIFAAASKKSLSRRIDSASRKWMNIKKMPTPEMIANLKGLFKDLAKSGWTVKPAQDFKQVLDDISSTGSAKTLPADTGSPPQKMKGVPR